MKRRVEDGTRHGIDNDELDTSSAATPDGYDVVTGEIHTFTHSFSDARAEHSFEVRPQHWIVRLPTIDRLHGKLLELGQVFRIAVGPNEAADAQNCHTEAEPKSTFHGQHFTPEAARIAIIVDNRGYH